MNSPGPSPADIQTHLYQSFLQRSTADVALKVSGTWSAVYRLHRVVLIQAGFFRSLFTAGFSESSPLSEIDIALDDSNITRAAFEFCIARLYGGGPALYIHPSIIPTSTSPLTPGFPYPQVDVSAYVAPDGQQPATPRFLMSLLATSLYFSIPSIASQTLSLILKTIGPYTIISYLNFALGKTVEYEDILSAAVGLDDVAEVLPEDDAEFESDFEDTSESIQREAPPAESPRTFHYGAISDKIGEACAVWLSRWGVDLFLHEEYDALKLLDRESSDATMTVAHSTSSRPRPRARTFPTAIEGTAFRKYVVPSIWIGDGLSPAWICALISSDSFFIDDERARYEFAKRVVEIRRRLKPMENKGEAPSQGKGKAVDRSMVELDDEEKEWAFLFETGIYYANMTPDVFLKLSNDISPTIGKPYAPLSILQAASWDHLLLRHAITERQSSSTTPSMSPTSSKGDLGIMVNGADLISSNTHASNNPPSTYFLVPVDESLRIGDTINVSGVGAVAEGNIHNNISMDQLFANSHAATRPTKGDKVSVTHSGPFTPDSRTFFGLVGDALVVSSADTRIRGAEDDGVGIGPGLSERLSKRTYSPHPPYRFSVEFWDLDTLKDKQRLHSKTIWYAGSLFNIYVQLIRKKDKPITGGLNAGAHYQLGIYLHRQSTVESIPPRSAPNPRIKKQEEEGQGIWCLPNGTNLHADLQGGAVLSKPKHGPSPSLPSFPSLSASTASGSLYTTTELRSPPSPPTRSGAASPIGGPSHRITSSLSTPSPRATLSLLPSLSSSLPSTSALGRTPSPLLPHNLASSATSSSTSITGSDLNNNALPNAVPSPPPLSQPYRDPRTVVSVYFSVLCSSPAGSAQTQFRSGPDVFKISQSWGWKSGGLLSVKAEDKDKASGLGNDHMGVPGREVSLRATVLLGVV